MKKSYKNVCLLYAVLVSFFALDAGEKDASPLLAYSDAATRTGDVDNQVVNGPQLEPDWEAEMRGLRYRVDSLRQQNRLLTEVVDSYEPFLPLHREREFLQAESEFLEKQNRILAEFCPILKEAVLKEHPGDLDPDVAQAWGVKE